MSLTVKCSAEVLNRFPSDKVGGVFVQRFGRGEDILVDDNIGRELGTKRIFYVCTGGVVYIVGELVKFFGGSDFKAAVNQFRSL